MQTEAAFEERYRMIEKLGEGSEGSVFLALYLPTDEFRAVKRIRAGSMAASCREPEMMKHLRNEHLPRIIDVLYQEPYIYLVMEHVRGMSLDRMLRSGGCVSEAQALEAGLQIADALCYLETRDPPVCHLDIKPSNLIRRPDGLIKLVDFGSAWKEKAQVRGTGTDGYAAPEQYPQSGHFPDARSDIYGLGATLYRMSAGKKWSAKMRLSCVPNCSKEMSDLIRKCLEEDPQERFQSAFSLKNALNAMRRRERLEKGRFRILASLAMAFPACALCLQILPSMFDLSADEAWDYGKLIREAGGVSVEESRE
jgi:serine/threonine-protein kinase